MKAKLHSMDEKYRKVHPVLGGSEAGSTWGYFEVSRRYGIMRIISSGVDMEFLWEHVSVSFSDHVPSWEDMQFVKEMFWDAEETVVQFHPRKSEYINHHPYVLHLWKRVGQNYSLPPKELIA
jgi:hypothetical protein